MVGYGWCSLIHFVKDKRVPSRREGFSSSLSASKVSENVCCFGENIGNDLPFTVVFSKRMKEAVTRTITYMQPTSPMLIDVCYTN